MITDEKIEELLDVIVNDFVLTERKEHIQNVRNWLEENGLEDHKEWTNKQRMLHVAEECECAMMFLDKLNVPKIDSMNNETYSLVGRIKLYKEM